MASARACPPCAPIVRLQADAFDAALETDALTLGRADIGALVTFTGLCRDEGATLAALELEYYPGMAERQMIAVAQAACAHWPLQGLLVVHRYGKISPGEKIVLVATAATHRAAAFEAAEFLMDYLKTSAPFWKKEHRRDGTAGDWVSAKVEDDDALARWTTKTKNLLP